MVTPFLPLLIAEWKSKLYTLIITSKFEFDLRKLVKGNPLISNKIPEIIRELSRNPYKGKLLVSNLKGSRSIRIATYRLMYEITQSGRQVILRRLRKRKKVYRNWKYLFPFYWHIFSKNLFNTINSPWLRGVLSLPPSPLGV